MFSRCLIWETIPVRGRDSAITGTMGFTLVKVKVWKTKRPPTSWQYCFANESKIILEYALYNCPYKGNSRGPELNLLGANLSHLTQLNNFAKEWRDTAICWKSAANHSSTFLA